MRSKQFIGVAVVLAVMCVLAGGVYAYDHGRRDHIAKGIRVGGVDVGGLTRGQAERRLEARYLGALHEPIVVHHATKTWKLGPREARVAADISAMVDEAVGAQPLGQHRFAHLPRADRRHRPLRPAADRLLLQGGGRTAPRPHPQLGRP